MKREKTTHIILEDGTLMKGPISRIIEVLEEFLHGEHGHWHEITLLSPSLRPELKPKPKKKRVKQ